MRVSVFNQKANEKSRRFEIKRRQFMSSKIKKIMVCASILSVLPFASFAATGTVDGNAVRLRKEPSSEGKIITLLEKGKTGEIVEEVDGWYKITTGASTGWVSSEYFKKDEVTTVATSSDVEEAVAELKNVVIDTSVVNIRKEPTTSSELLGQAEQGQLLEVVAETEATDGVWYKIKLGEEEYGYVRSDLITSDLSQVKSEGKVTGSVVNIRKEPTTDSESLGKITEGTVVEINDISGEWYQISYSGKTGYVHSDYLEIVVSNLTSRSGAGSSKVRKVIEIVKNQLGKRYVWGAEGPSTFDCSGLMKYAYGQVGIALNRVSSDQAKNGIEVSKSNLQPGDLVFFSGINSSSSSSRISHVGMYIGNGEFIHAANSKRGVVKDSLNTSYYSNHFVTARRIIR